MIFFDILTMIGGLALFLFGMKIMGDGLAKASGGRMEAILEKLTSNPVKAVLVGALVTGVIQSSSATTVMVVGFVNSGIMKLSQAVGIIMGANIGTTVTAWVLSLAGISSDNFFISLLKPSAFSPILALVGIVFLMFSKKEKKHDIGTIFLGFAVLMFGMETMSNTVKPLADVPQFTNMLLLFQNPIFGILAGTALTAIIQSSSASVGILQALCITGRVSYGTALPIIMGQNIGTCITALLSSIGTEKNAKRAALVHLYFNIIGTVVFMILFYGIHYFVRFDFLNDMATAWGIAVIHTLFNVLATVLLLPFSKGLEKLACLTIPEKEVEIEKIPEEKELKRLDVLFLDTPGYAMEACKHVTVAMAKLSQKALDIAVSQIWNYDKQNAQEVIRLEKEVDRYEDEIGTYLMKLSSKNLSEDESQMLSVLLHSIGDIERISDHARNIQESAQEIYEKKFQFTDKAQEELHIFTNAVHEILDMAILSLEREDIMLANLVEPLEEVIDRLRTEIKRRHIKRLRKGKCTIEMGFILSDITTDYERVADHCSNIAVSLLQLSENSFETHEYLEAVKNSGNIDFTGKVLAFQEKYVLP